MARLRFHSFFREVGDDFPAFHSGGRRGEEPLILAEPLLPRRLLRMQLHSCPVLGGGSDVDCLETHASRHRLLLQSRACPPPPRQPAARPRSNGALCRETQRREGEMMLSTSRQHGLRWLWPFSSANGPHKLVEEKHLSRSLGSRSVVSHPVLRLSYHSL